MNLGKRNRNRFRGRSIGKNQNDQVLTSVTMLTSYFVAGMLLRNKCGL